MPHTASRISLDTTIIIPQYNHVELTCNCLKSLYEHHPTIASVIMVDDGSTPDCCERLRQTQYSNLQIIEQPHRGVTAAWNFAATKVDNRYVIFLNNDVITSGSWIDRLIHPLQKKSAIISGVSVRRESSLPLNILSMLPTTLFLEGWCFAVTLEDFLSIDGFDETMTSYWSDTDFQARLLKKENLPETPIASIPDLPLKHLGHRTAHDRACLPNRREIWKQDRATFISKWATIR